MTMRPAPYLLCFVTVLAGCAGGFVPFPTSSAPSADPTSAANVTEAAAEAASQTLRAGGQTVASLGNPGEQGLWLRTPLVNAEGPGQITTEGGRTLAVTLRPIPGNPGAGSQISLAAMQALGQPLTALVSLTVAPR